MGLLGFFKGKDENGAQGGKPQQPAPSADDYSAVPEEPMPESEQPQKTSANTENRYEKKAEDIISQLAHLNSILEEDDTGSEGLSDIVEPEASSPTASDEFSTAAPEPAAPTSIPTPIPVASSNAPAAKADDSCVVIAAEEILPAVPAEVLADSVDNLNAANAGNEAYFFSFRHRPLPLP